MNNKAKNMKNYYWVTPKGVAKFASQRRFGVVNEAGTHAVFSKETGDPMVWTHMSTVKEFASYAHKFTNTYWARVYTDFTDAVSHAKAAKEPKHWWEEGYVHTGTGPDPRTSHVEMAKRVEEMEDEEVPDNAWEMFFEYE
jgi:hypothetical protein